MERMEKQCFIILTRGGRWPWIAALLLVCLISQLIAPLVVTRQWSWERTDMECRGHLDAAAHTLFEFKPHLSEIFVSITGGLLSTQFNLLPGHWLKFVSTAVSCGCLCIMCFHFAGMPSISEKAVLGRTLLFYFATRCCANIVGPYLTLSLLCAHGALYGKFLFTLLWTIGFQLLLTNLLKHHYLLTKVPFSFSMCPDNFHY